MKKLIRNQLKWFHGWTSIGKEVGTMQKRMFMTIVKLDGKHRTVKAAGTVAFPGGRKEPAGRAGRRGN